MSDDHEERRGALRDGALRIGRMGMLPILPSERLTQMERVGARLSTMRGLAEGGGRMGDDSWNIVSGRMHFDDLSLNKRRDVRLAIASIWDDDMRDRDAAPLVAFSLGERFRTYDRELVLAYLRHFPWDHPAFAVLTAAAGAAAERHDWAWKERGRRFNLWDAEDGPKSLGQALLAAEVPPAVLRDAGLDGDLASGLFVEDALDEACEQAGSARGEGAERLGSQLVALFDVLKAGGDDAMLAYALLDPWRTAAPSDTHSKAISRILVQRIGDPRLNPARWMAIKAELADRKPGVDSEALVAVLRHWLTQATVRAFFRIVGRTTDRKDQWDEREAFWLGYLDSGAIHEAWFAFGRRAESIAGNMAREEDVRYGRVVGGADPSHSALVFSIGDYRLSEWSHNGAFRIWPEIDRDTPTGSARYYKPPELYQDEYDGNLLRSTHGPSGFNYLSHVSGWQMKFARAIHRATGVSHPIYGRG